MGSATSVATLGGTTALLLLAVFAVVNVAVLVLRQDKAGAKHFQAPTALPIIGMITCLYLVTPLSGRAPPSTWSPAGCWSSAWCCSSSPR